MAEKKNLDPMSEAAMEVVNMDRQREEAIRLKQQEREELIAKTHEIVGRVQASNMIARFADVGSLVWLKQVKETKIYRDLPMLGTWDKFCEYIGLSRSKVDEDLQNIDIFGQEFLTTCRQFSVGYRDLRKLRRLAQDGSVVIDGDALIIDDETIPLKPDYKEDLEAAIERVIDAKDQLLQEKDAVIRAKDKLIDSKKELILRQEKDLARYEKEAAERGFEPGEEGWLKRLEQKRLVFDGIMAFISPDVQPVPDDATARMKARYLECLGYMRRIIEAAHDTAVDLYSTAGFDNDWEPQPLRVVGKEEGEK